MKSPYSQRAARAFWLGLFGPMLAFGQAPAVPPSAGKAPAMTTAPGMPPVVDPANLYSETVAGKLSATVAADLPRVYVPNVQSNDVYVIDPATFKVVDRFKVGVNPQHVVPSWDLRTLWVANNAEGRTDGSLTPIDPKTGKPGHADRGRRSVQHVFLARRQIGDRRRRSVKRLDFRDPQTMELQYSIDVPVCRASITRTSRSTVRDLHVRLFTWPRSMSIARSLAK